MSSFSFSNLLRNRQSIIQGIVKREVGASSAAVMLAFAVLAIALYGGVMGSFVQGDIQAWLQHSEKLLKILMGSFLLSLPSLYIFSAFRGSKLTLSQLLMLSVVGFGTLGLVLIGFLPIAWFFTWISETVFFIRPLHIVMIGVAWLFLIIVIGQGLNEAYRMAEQKADKQARHSLDIYGLWVIVLLVVTVQMASHLSPYFVREVPLSSITRTEQLPADQVLDVSASVRAEDGLGASKVTDVRAEYTADGALVIRTPQSPSNPVCYEFSDYAKSYSQCPFSINGAAPTVDQATIGVKEKIAQDFLSFLPFFFRGEMQGWSEPVSRETVTMQGRSLQKITYQRSDVVSSARLILYEDKETGVVKTIEMNEGEKEVMVVKILFAELRPLREGDDRFSLEGWKRTLPFPDAKMQAFLPD